MEMIKEIRSKLAREQILAFIDKMKKLGFNKEEIVAMVAQTGGEA